MAQDAIVLRQKLRFRFRDPDMDFVFGWLLGAGVITGLSPGELFQLAESIRERDPASWRKTFERHGDFLVARAIGMLESGGHDFLAAAFAYRAAIQYTDPTGKHYAPLVAAMEGAFAKAVEGQHIPITPVAIPFEGKILPGYWLKQPQEARATLLMIGGGDSYREDLYYFAGEPGWRRGYDVLMVDLPGQGKLPGDGLTFRPDMAAPITTIIDWLEQEAPGRTEHLAIYGVSGGGYFTAQAVARDTRIKAWIASTPIIDMALVFQREFGAVLKTPGWLLGLGAWIAGLRDASKRLTYRKYGWQWGVSGMAEAVRGSIEQAPRVDVSAIHCPSLLLVGKAEAQELQRQTHETHAQLSARGVDVTLRAFTAEEGADAHCQVNNFPLAHRVVFDWLDTQFSARA